MQKEKCLLKVTKSKYIHIDNVKELHIIGPVYRALTTVKIDENTQTLTEEELQAILNTRDLSSIDIVIILKDNEYIRNHYDMMNGAHNHRKELNSFLEELENRRIPIGGVLEWETASNIKKLAKSWEFKIKYSKEEGFYLNVKATESNTPGIYDVIIEIVNEIGQTIRSFNKNSDKKENK